MKATAHHASGADAIGADHPMRAIVQERYGSSEVLHLAQIARPTPAPGEVLLRVHAAGLDRGTWHLMTGLPYAQRPVTGFRRPRNAVPGRDVAGTVVAIGSAVTTIGVGDEVYGIAPGSFAEYAVAAPDKLARKPANISFAQAAVLPVSGLTALRAVTDVGRIAAGQRVLISGASGGVGSYAVQIAKAFGAHVTGVSSTAKLDLVRALGADDVLDYTRDEFADGTHRYDVILDIAGNPTVARLRRALTPTGTAVIVGGEEGGNLTGGMSRQLRALALSPFLRQRLTMVVPQERASDLERLTPLIEAGTVTPSIDSSYPLHHAQEAMRRLESGTVRGKIAITIQ